MFNRILCNKLNKREKYVMIALAYLSFVLLKNDIAKRVAPSVDTMSIILYSFMIGLVYFALFSWFVYELKAMSLKAIPLPRVYYLYLLVFIFRNLFLTFILYFFQTFAWYWIMNLVLTLTTALLCFTIMFFLLKKYASIYKGYALIYWALILVYLLVSSGLIIVYIV